MRNARRGPSGTPALDGQSMLTRMHNKSMRIALFLLVAALASAQQTRREQTNNSPNPADDKKPNSASVPDVYAIDGQFDRIVTLRFKFGADLLAGIEKMVAQEKIKNAVILAGAGSVRGYQVHQVSNRDFPSKNMFEKDANAPADMISMNGYIINGAIHAHMTLATPDHAFGGHLEPGTEVFTFGIVTIGVMREGVDFSHLDDKTYR
jgi:predicted DNA-binding protein with PD1-like motif